jgi:SAM-dependent methyltransferase
MPAPPRAAVLRLRAIVSPLGAESLLDAGCGAGETIERLGDLLPTRIAAVDLSAEAVEFTAARLPHVEVARESAAADEGDGEQIQGAAQLALGSETGAAVRTRAVVAQQLRHPQPGCAASTGMNRCSSP